MEMKIKDRFSPKKIADSGQCFRVKYMGENTLRFIYRSYILYISPISRDVFKISCPLEEWDNIWHHFFDLKRIYRDIPAKTSPDDPFMRDCARFGRGIRILNQDPWEMLVSFIISQRKSIPAIKKCVEALCLAFGSPIDTGRETVYTFPSPEDLARATPDRLKDCGLGYRVPYVTAAAESVAEKKIILEDLFSVDTPSLLSALQTIHGVGVKVANCVALFSYGRTECVPVDTWINKIIQNRYQGEDPFPRYNKDAGIMQQYVFFYIQNHKTLT